LENRGETKTHLTKTKTQLTALKARRKKN
jgi:hypothetical protein